MSQNHLPSNSDLSSDFGHFILEMLKNLKLLTKVRKFSVHFWGDIPPEFQTGGNAYPHPPGGDTHVAAFRSLCPPQNAWCRPLKPPLSPPNVPCRLKKNGRCRQPKKIVGSDNMPACHLPKALCRLLKICCCPPVNMSHLMHHAAHSVLGLPKALCHASSRPSMG